MAAAVVGLLLGGLVVFFLEWIESDVIRSAQDVERYIGVTVLGTIPPFADKRIDCSAPGGRGARNASELKRS